ncbi:ribokinase [Micromonospora polyrhachis]|uniref:Ribokinase n=1 Tax=Micromonospora polyrhachis TaxID=1282883 RepID=A0A7W7WNI9_9ACTN|nr:ribokinase [Micromonospora polyrhachis]MBB4957677.1 ribokinase [Micromonospora polyrhachis]
MTARVVVVGSVNLDLVVNTPSLPRPGETVLGHGFDTVPGGKGANQAVAAARAGGACAFVGAVGQDGFAAQLRDNLATAGVDVTRLRSVPGPSGVALIAVDTSAENFIVVAPGANGGLTRLDEADKALVAAADVLLLQLETPLTAVTEAAEAARAGGTTVILNAAPARSLPAELLALVDVLVVNQGEAATIVGRDDEPEALLTALLDLVPRVVLTLGARGAAYADRAGLRLTVAAPRVDAVDTTASGDSFTGAFAVAWAERGATPGTAVAGVAAPEAVVAALRWACAAGAACARRPGASTAIPTRDEIDELSATTYGATG